MKKILVVICALVLSIGTLAACSGNKDDNSKGASNGGKGLSGDFEIQYFVGGYGDEWWKHVIEEFQNANPDLNIKQSAGPQINDQMRPRWINGNPPDVIYIDGAGANEMQMIEDDQLLDITAFLQGAKNKDGEKLMDIVLMPPQKVGDKNYSIPLVFGAWGTFYDKAWFEEKGWEVPTDWDSFLAISEQIKQSGISPYIYTGVYPYYPLGGLVDSAIVEENNGDPEILERMANNEEGSFTDQAVIDGLQKVVEMRDKGYFDPGAIALNHTDSQIQFLQHKAAFIPNGLWLPNEMDKDIPDGFEFGYIPSVVQSKGENYIAIPYTNNVAIAKDAKNPEAAKAFIEFIFTKQYGVDWAEMTGAIMNVKADLESSTASEVSKDAMRFFNADNITISPTVPQVVFNADIEQAREDSTIALIKGDITPEQWSKNVENAAKKSR